MKAIVYTEYGPPEVLKLREVAKPEPKDNQVLVRVVAASANALDYRRFEMTSMLGRFMDERLFKSINKVLGADIVGRVEAVGGLLRNFSQAMTCSGYPRYPRVRLPSMRVLLKIM